jgi:hypothetical protein
VPIAFSPLLQMLLQHLQSVEETKYIQQDRSSSQHGTAASALI